MLAGGSLASFGVLKRSWLGAGLAAGGGYLIYRGVSDGANPEINIAKSVTIYKPVEELYRFWRSFENLPRFMRHLRAVRVIDDRRSHWVAAAPIGEIEWDAEITDERENDHISWHSLAGSRVEHVGRVEFRSAPGDRGTEVHVYLSLRPPAGRIGRAIAMIMGEDPEQQIREDLRRFKMLMEAGEIATIDGQPSGRRSLKIRTLQPFDRESIGNRELSRAI
jgi:uncharacterized membrane protein